VRDVAIRNSGFFHHSGFFHTCPIPAIGANGTVSKNNPLYFKMYGRLLAVECFETPSLQYFSV
jgi:hypothetical protein